jgi:hypothetical protein
MRKRVLHTMLAALVVLSAGCASSHQNLMGSGAALKTVGQQWLSVNEGFVKGCAPTAVQKLPQDQCDKAREFGVKFKQAYPLAIQLYETAVNAKDTSMAADAKSVIRGLSADLVKFGLQVGLTLQEVK